MLWSKDTEHGFVEKKKIVKFPVAGRRVIRFSHIASQMYCQVYSAELELIKLEWGKVRTGQYFLTSNAQLSTYLNKLKAGTAHTVPSVAPDSVCVWGGGEGGN